MPSEYTIDIMLEDAPGTASIAGRRYYAHLPAGYLWVLSESYLYLDTSKAAAADSWLCKLYRDSDDAVMATATTTGALTQANAMTLSTDLEIDASGTTPAKVYVAFVNSGAGAAMGEGMRVLARFIARRPA